MANTKLTSRQVIAIHALMAQHCKKGDDGFANYDEGWDDNRIMKDVVNPELDRSIPITSVARLRMENFGRIRKIDPMADGRVAALEKRLVELEEDQKGLLDWITRVARLLQDKYPNQRNLYAPPQGRPRSVPPMGMGVRHPRSGPPTDDAETLIGEKLKGLLK
jgi:hypothetical protein